MTMTMTFTRLGDTGGAENEKDMGDDITSVGQVEGERRGATAGTRKKRGRNTHS